eukprot:COSAG01_NODE_2233_length_8112_cov_41.569699_8_plen_218_part_00
MPGDDNRKFRRQGDSKRHANRCKGVYYQRSFNGTVAKKKVDLVKREIAQEKLDKVMCGNTPLKNVSEFKYLGHWFTCGGDVARDVEIRMAHAATTFFKLNHVWRCKELPQSVKINIYRGAVCSILTYAQEAWVFNDKLVGKIKNWNARLLKHITGRDIIEEYNTPTYDLVAGLRARRLRWLGHILRSDATRLLRQIVLRPQCKRTGSIWKDTPCATV